MRSHHNATRKFVTQLHANDVAGFQWRKFMGSTIVILLLLTLSVHELFTNVLGMSWNELRLDDWQLRAESSIQKQLRWALI
jgi:hypothetical protein